MKKIGLHEIRREFLEFFKEKEHLVVPSYSLVPDGDDSLLLIGAGMAPLKKYFTGEATPPKNRMATCQKCIRTGDIENVGKTDRHATFFEMLGNFSFGDYFKIESMEWAWEFLHDRMGIREEDLWVSVYEEDDEAFELWKNEIGIEEHKIVRLGKEDNFWELEVGPSGPCSEIFVDRGEEYGCDNPDCKPGCECDRFIEVWNLVFTQYDKDEAGNYHRLAHPNIDTGMGLERLATVMEGANNIFEIEAIQDIIGKIESISNYKYGVDSKKDESVRVITDHARAMTFLVSDGVVPGNEGRGYVLRRLIRRAARHGKLLGIQGNFLTDVCEVIIDSWKIEYRDIDKNRDRIAKVIDTEESRFQETIDAGIERLDKHIISLKESGKNILDGEDAFKLYDTYGFPIDLTKEILLEEGIKVDELGFNKKMEEQRERARQARKTDNIGWSNQGDKDLYKGLDTEFIGYDNLSSESRVIRIIKDEEIVEKISSGDEAIIVLDETPFYGESGGQVGDKGYIAIKNKFKGEILDTQILHGDIIAHIVRVVEGGLEAGAEVATKVLENRRQDIKRNHTATHLLHRSLKNILGEHVNQAGSLVLPDRLRFDFTHYEQVKAEDLKKIEEEVNRVILQALEIEVINTSLKEAREAGIIGLFEDKYDDKVRVISIGDYSKELCGGTHVSNTSEIGLIKILSENGVSSGVRRIEAITGKEVYNYILDMERELDSISSIVRSDRENLIKKVEEAVEDRRKYEKEIHKLRKELAADISEEILDSTREVKGIKYIAYKLDSMDMESMRNLGDELRTKLGSGVVVLASTLNDKVSFLTMTTKDLNKKGIMAGDIVREVAKVTGGNGGGRPDMAQAGGKDISKLDEALGKVSELIEKKL